MRILATAFPQRLCRQEAAVRARLRGGCARRSAAWSPRSQHPVGSIPLTFGDRRQSDAPPAPVRSTGCARHPGTSVRCPVVTVVSSPPPARCIGTPRLNLCVLPHCALLIHYGSSLIAASAGRCMGQLAMRHGNSADGNDYESSGPPAAASCLVNGPSGGGCCPLANLIRQTANRQLCSFARARLPRL